MAVDRVYFHYQFMNGTFNTPYFKDIAQFNATDPTDMDYQDRIFTFADDLLNGKILIGKNKYNTGTAYQNVRAGHYHIGPYTHTSSCRSAYIDRHNPNGAGSAAVIHYCWKGKLNEIVLLAFSPNHNPFPSITDRSNALRTRMKTVYGQDELVLIGE